MSKVKHYISDFNRIAILHKYDFIQNNETLNERVLTKVSSHTIRIKINESLGTTTENNTILYSSQNVRIVLRVGTPINENDKIEINNTMFLIDDFINIDPQFIEIKLKRE